MGLICGSVTDHYVQMKRMEPRFMVMYACVTKAVVALVCQREFLSDVGSGSMKFFSLNPIRTGFCLHIIYTQTKIIATHFDVYLL